MSWSYAPVSLAINTDPTETCSAVFVTDKSRKRGYILACLELKDGLDVYATMDSFVKSERIEWAPVEVVHTNRLAKLQQAVRRLQGSYDYEPSDHRPTVTVLQFTSRSALGQALQSNLTDFQVVDKSHGRVKVHCSPFASVNPALFLGYTAYGHISHVSRDLILSDVRYLSGMNGGLVLTEEEDTQSIGMVMGKLKKSNNEGELTVIAPWKEILNASQHLPLRLAPTKALQTSNTPVWQGVAALTVNRSDGAMLWGSGVLISKGIVITNAHVIDNHSSITVFFDRENSVVASLLSIPIQGVDLAFLQISKAHGYKPLPLCRRPVAQGQAVKSIGYGLFSPSTFHDQDLTPLVSHGRVNKVVSGALWDDANALTTPIMLISSAGCWNGSSGGAVVTNKNELVGVMASNGKMDSGEIIPTMSFVIPVYQLIEYAWHLAKNGYSVDTTDFVKDTWSLKHTHDSVLLKSKL